MRGTIRAKKQKKMLYISEVPYIPIIILLFFFIILNIKDTYQKNFFFIENLIIVCILYASAYVAGLLDFFMGVPLGPKTPKKFLKTGIKNSFLKIPPLDFHKMF